MDSLISTSEETLQQVIDRFWETIPPVWSQIRANVRAIAAERYGISVQQFHILRYVRRGIHLASELASVTQLSRPAISQAVDVLVEKGLITRHTSARDRRCIELELTESGTDMLNAIFAENHRWMMQKMASLSPEELDNILLGMKAIKKTFIG